MMDVSAFAENLSVHLNDTNSTVTSPWRMTMITLITIPLSLITITGNVLVIISFRVNPHLRTVSNYFLLSLASADVILGAVSMNLYTTYILLGRWALGSLACDVWLALDYVASNASVMNLLAISVDRYLSVMRPLTYRATRTPKRAAILITLAWSVSFVLWAPAILFWQYIVGERTVPEGECFIQFLSQPVITFGTAIAAFYLPVSVMVALYWRVYRVTEKRSQQLSGLMASHGQHSGNKKQKAGPSSVHSIEEVKPEARRNQHGSICPTFSWQARILRNKRREKDKASSSRTSSHPNTETKHAPQNSEDNDKDIPLVSMDDSESETPNSTKKSCRSSSVDVTVSASSPSGQCRKVKTSSLIKEKKAARTLSAILLAFIVTWTPYNIMVLVSTFCEECVPDGLWQLGYWLCYVNSTVNPVCYALCNKHFRVTFRALLLCKWKEQRKAIRWTPTGNG